MFKQLETVPGLLLATAGAVPGASALPVVEPETVTAAAARARAVAVDQIGSVDTQAGENFRPPALGGGSDG